MGTVSVQQKKAPGPEEDITNAYSVMKTQNIALQSWALGLPVVLLGSSEESMNRLMPAAIKLGGTEVRITEVGSREWFGNKAIWSLDNGQKNLAALAVAMGNLREEDLPRQLYRTAMSMLTSNQEIDDNTAKNIGNQLMKYAILADNKKLDVSAAWGDGLARKKEIVQAALAQVDRLANAERYAEARMLQNSVITYIDSVEKLGVREGGVIKSVDRRFDGTGMENALMLSASGRLADPEASASFLRSYISCQSAYLEDVAKSMPAGRDAVLRELRRARTETNLTDAMGELDRASFALQMSSSYAQLQQQYKEISDYEKMQKPASAESLSQMLKKCETALNTMNLDAYKAAMGDFMQRYGELVTKKHMEENRKDAFLQLASAQLAATERYWRFVWADGGNKRAMNELKNSMDYLSKAQEAMTNGNEKEARNAYQKAMECKFAALGMYGREPGRAGLAKPPPLSMETRGKTGYEQYLSLQMAVLDDIYVKGRWPKSDDPKVRGAELIEQSVFYIPGSSLGNYAADQRSVRESVNGGDIAAAEKTAYGMMDRLMREKVWMTIGQTAGGIAVGVVPYVGGLLAFGWFANMARESLVYEYRTTGTVSPGSVAMSTLMVAPLGLGIAGRILTATGRTGAAAWATTMIIPMTGVMVGAGVWGGAESIAAAAKTDDMYRRNTLLIQAALNLSMAGMGVVGGVLAIRGGATMQPAMDLMARRISFLDEMNALEMLTGQPELAYATAGGGIRGIRIMPAKERPTVMLMNEEKPGAGGGTGRQPPAPDLSTTPAAQLRAPGAAKRAAGQLIGWAKTTPPVKWFGKTFGKKQPRTAVPGTEEYYGEAATDIWKTIALMDETRFNKARASAENEIRAEMRSQIEMRTQAGKATAMDEVVLKVLDKPDAAAYVKTLVERKSITQAQGEEIMRAFKETRGQTEAYRDLTELENAVNSAPKHLAEMMKALYSCVRLDKSCWETMVRLYSYKSVRLALKQEGVADADLAKINQALDVAIENAATKMAKADIKNAVDNAKEKVGGRFLQNRAAKTDAAEKARKNAVREAKEAYMTRIELESELNGSIGSDNAKKIYTTAETWGRENTGREGVATELIGPELEHVSVPPAEPGVVPPRPEMRPGEEAPRVEIAESGAKSYKGRTVVTTKSILTECNNATRRAASAVETIKAENWIAEELKAGMRNQIGTATDVDAALLAALRSKPVRDAVDARLKALGETEESRANIMKIFDTALGLESADARGRTFMAKSLDEVLEAMPKVEAEGGGKKSFLPDLTAIRNNAGLKADLITAHAYDGMARTEISKTTLDAAKIASKGQQFTIRPALVTAGKGALGIGDFLTGASGWGEVAKAGGWKRAWREATKPPNIVRGVVVVGGTIVLVWRSAEERDKALDEVSNRYGLQPKGKSAEFLLTDKGQECMYALPSWKMKREDCTIRQADTKTMEEYFDAIEARGGLVFNPDRLDEILSDAAGWFPRWQEKFKNRTLRMDMADFVNSRLDTWKENGYIFEKPVYAVAYNFCREAGLNKGDRLEAVKFLGDNPALLKDLIVEVASGKLLLSELRDVLFETVKITKGKKEVDVEQLVANKESAEQRLTKRELPVAMAENSFLRNLDRAACAQAATKDRKAKDALTKLLPTVRKSTDALNNLNAFTFDRATEAVYGDFSALGNMIIKSTDAASLANNARAGNLTEGVIGPKALGYLDARLYTEPELVRYVVQNSAKDPTTGGLDAKGAGVYGWLRANSHHLVNRKFMELLRYEHTLDRVSISLEGGDVSRFYDPATKEGRLPQIALLLQKKGLYEEKTALPGGEPNQPQTKEVAWWMTEAETFNTIVQNTSAREEPPRAVTFVNEEARKQLDKLLDDIEITEDKGKRPLTADERNWVITMLKNAAVYNAKPKENPELKRYSQLAKPTGIAVELDKDGAINEVSMPEPGTPRWNETRNWLVNYLASEGG